MFRPSNIKIIAHMLVSDKNEYTLSYIGVKIYSAVLYGIRH